jgi:hypothetical protein
MLPARVDMHPCSVVVTCSCVPPKLDAIRKSFQARELLALLGHRLHHDAESSDASSGRAACSPGVGAGSWPSAIALLLTPESNKHALRRIRRTSGGRNAQRSRTDVIVKIDVRFGLDHQASMRFWSVMARHRRAHAHRRHLIVHRHGDLPDDGAQGLRSPPRHC